MSDKPIPLVTWRGKRIDNGERVYGYLAIQGDKAYIRNGYSFDATMSTLYLGSFVEVYLESLAVFTGLYDANGTPIFSSVGEFRGGDVISDAYKVCCGEVQTGDVFYLQDEGLFAVGILYEDGSKHFEVLYECNRHLKIIGNAYANPELLQVQS